MALIIPLAVSFWLFALHLLDIRATEVYTPAVRSSPMVWDFGSGPTVVFGWVPSPNNPCEGRISAVRLETDMANDSGV